MDDRDSPSSILDPQIVLASRSPRRRELLSTLVPRERIRVMPPASSEEAGFDGLTSLAAIEIRLLEIAAAKCDDVRTQLAAAESPDESSPIVIAADTVIVADREANNRGNGYAVLGQPPEADWRETTRRWFLDHYAGKTHRAVTGLCIQAESVRRELVVTTHVTFRANVEQYLDWYIATGEPRGKAGGYAIQGAGSLFVERIEGSLTNVIGLPLEETLDLLRRLKQV